MDEFGPVTMKDFGPTFQEFERLTHLLEDMSNGESKRFSYSTDNSLLVTRIDICQFRTRDQNGFQQVWDELDLVEGLMRYKKEGTPGTAEWDASDSNCGFIPVRGKSEEREIWEGIIRPYDPDRTRKPPTHKGDVWWLRDDVWVPQDEP